MPIEAGLSGLPAVGAGAHPVVGVAQRDAAHAMLAAELDGAPHGGERVQIARAAMPSQRSSAPKRATASACLRIDAAVADGFNKTRKAIDAVRVDAVARGFGKEARASLGAICGESKLAQNRCECGLNGFEWNAVHRLCIEINAVRRCVADLPTR